MPPPATPNSTLELRPLIDWDPVAVGHLMWVAYRGTIDDEYPTEDDALADAEGALGGRWGPVIWQASVTAAHAGRLVAAVINVYDSKHDMTPLLAFALTEPDWQGRGIGGWLIEESVSRLDDLGESELHLAVTRGSPAQRLYERLGFRVVDH
jgi:GNAT superfamily N-acetyltransferase